jgi:hypothetical protein
LEAENSPNQMLMLDFGFPSLQNYETGISILYKLPSLRYFVLATSNGLRQEFKNLWPDIGGTSTILVT